MRIDPDRSLRHRLVYTRIRITKAIHGIFMVFYLLFMSMFYSRQELDLMQKQKEYTFQKYQQQMKKDRQIEVEKDYKNVRGQSNYAKPKLG